MDRVITRRYRTDAVTVIWQPDKCSHSGICFRGLPDVFDPRRRPWVDVRAAASDAPAHIPPGAPQVTADATAGGVMVEPLRDGPLVVHGTVRVRAADGSHGVVGFKG